MIVDYRDGIVFVRCPFCGESNEFNLEKMTPPNPLPEHGNKPTAIPMPPCSRCGAVGFLNPELPPASEDMKVSDHIPDDEWRQRTIVRAVVSALKSKKRLPSKIPPIPKSLKRDPNA